MGDVLRRSNQGRLPRMLQILLVLLYVVPWIPPVPIGGGGRMQLYTVALIALGVYQLWLAMVGWTDLDQTSRETGPSRGPLANQLPRPSRSAIGRSTIASPV
jgi:hypothetical protein